MKELTQHQTNELNLQIKVQPYGERSMGGAYSLYLINYRDEDDRPQEQYLRFHTGQLADGINGITDEAVLAILADRRRDYQNGPYADKHTAAALACIEQALAHLQARTLERRARGVEGTHGL